MLLTAPLMKRSVLTISVFLLLILNAFAIRAQSQRGIPTYGTDFYGAALLTQDACRNASAFAGLFLLISSDYDTRVEILYFDQTGKQVSGGTYYIPARSYKQIPLDYNFVHGSKQGDTAEYRAFRIRSSNPVSCSYLTTGPAQTSMSLLLPTSALGKRYVVGTMPNSTPPASSVPPYCTPYKESSRFTVVAALDSTHIVITPNGRTRGGRIGTRFGDSSNGTVHPFTVLLRRGQTYAVLADTSTALNDEAGSIVESDKPVAVMAGHDAALNNVTSSAYWGQDQRNTLAQELLPYKFWSTHDYLGVPMIDSSTASTSNPGAGEKVRCVTYETFNTIRLQSDNGYDTSAPIDRFQTFDVANVQSGYNVGSATGQPVLPFAIDYRLMAPSTVASAPALLQLTAWDDATSRYSFSVPGGYDVRVRHYLTIITRADQFTKISYYKDGQGPKALVGLPQIGGNYAIPGHEELLGRTFEVIGGSYNLKADSNFLAYRYGRLSYSIDYSWGLNDNSTYCGEYATVVGMRLRSCATARPHVIASRSCDAWTLRIVSDSTAPLAYATVLNDPTGLYVRRTADSGYVSKNISPRDTTLFDTSATITISVTDPAASATAYVWIVNQAGNDTVLTLNYTARVIAYSRDSLFFPMRAPLSDTCMTVFVRNRSTADTISVLQLQMKDTNFTLSPLKPLPVRITPGDSLGVRICFSAKTSRATDTLRLTTDCNTLLLPVSGSTFQRSIYATDWDFGKTPVGQRKVHTVNVKNTGKSDVTLTKNWRLHDTAAFAFADSAKLALTLKPGQSVDLKFAYAPLTEGLDSTWIDWGTDMVAPYEHSEKNFSQLWGTAVSPGLVWSRQSAAFGTWGQQEDTLTLLNPSNDAWGQSDFVDSVVIHGPSSSDFSIVDDELKKLPLINFELRPQDRSWIKLRFAPIDTLTNTSPRRDTLYAFDENYVRPYVLLNGYIGVASVRSAAMVAAFEFNWQTNRLECIAKEPGWRVACYDVLGREVWSASTVNGRTTIDLSSLPSGLYVAFATNGVATRSYRFLRP